MAERLVYDLLQVYENFTRLHTYANLSWSHYRQTLSIPKAAHRRFYLQVASERQWTVRELHTAIKRKAVEQGTLPAISADPSVDIGTKVLTPRYGTLHRYRGYRSSTGNPIHIDVGFGIAYTGPTAGLDELEDGQTVASETQDGRFVLKPVNDSSDRLYTYGARVVRVVDGDTLLVKTRSWFPYAIYPEVAASRD